MNNDIIRFILSPLNYVFRIMSVAYILNNGGNRFSRPLLMWSRFLNSADIDIRIYGNILRSQ